ncbi:MAG: TlpA disulfide reductase family protein [Actinomycetota bacterium]
MGGVAAVAVTCGVMLLGCATDNGGSTGTSGSGRVRVAGPARTSLFEPGEEVPSFSAPALGGGRIEWETYRGRPVVLVLWMLSCPHCRAELPVLASVAKDFTNVALVAITCGIGQGELSSVEEYMEDGGLTFPVAVDDESDTLARAFGIRYVPTIYFVESDGRVFRVVEGESPEATLRGLFEALD